MALRSSKMGAKPSTTVSLVPVYVAGFQRMKISEVKKHLFSLHFMLSKIGNISFVGKSTIEFLVFKDYQKSFQSRCSILGWEVLDKYDPSKPSDLNATSLVAEKVKSAFLTRLKTNVETSNRPLVKKFFSDWYGKVTGLSLSDNPVTTGTTPTGTPAPHSPLTLSSQETREDRMIVDVVDIVNLVFPEPLTMVETEQTGELGAFLDHDDDQ
jgi:hypothetical protein